MAMMAVNKTANGEGLRTDERNSYSSVFGCVDKETKQLRRVYCFTNQSVFMEGPQCLMSWQACGPALRKDCAEEQKQCKHVCLVRVEKLRLYLDMDLDAERRDCKLASRLGSLGSLGSWY